MIADIKVYHLYELHHGVVLQLQFIVRHIICNESCKQIL